MADDTETSDEPARERASSGGVHIPAWLAAALVVVLGLAIGGVGYAIGNSNGGGSSDERIVNPVANARPAGQPGLGAGGPLGDQGRRGERGQQGGECQGRDHQDQNGNGDQSENGNNGDQSDTGTSRPPGPVGPATDQGPGL